MDADKKEKLKSILKEVAIQLGHALITFGLPMLINLLQKNSSQPVIVPRPEEQNPADTLN